MNDEQPISFVGTTASNSTTEKVHEFTDSGTITRAKIVTHSNQEYGLRNYAALVRNGSETNLWKSLDEPFLAGNGQTYDLPVRFEFEEGDELVLEAENVSSYDYHHNMTFAIDYEGTVERFANQLRRRLE